jgi:hypothetical protein
MFMFIVNAGKRNFGWSRRKIELANNAGLTARQIRAAKTLIEEHDDEIRNAWQRHFGR